MFSVNFPVVGGGFALLAATGATQAIVGGSTVFTTSVIGGATGLLGKASSWIDKQARMVTMHYQWKYLHSERRVFKMYEYVYHLPVYLTTLFDNSRK